MRYVRAGLCSIVMMIISTHTIANFVDQLDIIDVSKASFLQQEYITRYDMAKYLSMADCQDCVHPSDQMQDLYDTAWMKTAVQTPQYSLDDLQNPLLYGEENYYYCVADVAEKGYMYGFPRQTSFYCPGKFCGDSLARFTDVVESLYRVIRTHVFSSYSVDRSKVDERFRSTQTVLPLRWSGDIATALERCGEQECPLTTARELDIMLWRCSTNPDACDFARYEAFPFGERPSAALSLLVREEIIPLLDARTLTMHDFVTPQQFLTYLDTTHEIADCSLDADYDHDGIVNSRDVCPTTYDPYQYDTDGDGVGNVCDDDIDGDGILNPVGLVDFQNIIIPRLWQDTQDNCPLVSGETADTDGDGIGDLCDADAEQSMLALHIDGTPRIGGFPLRVQFSEQYVGALDSLVWDYGDGYQEEGLSPEHIYTTPGSYLVTASANFQQKKQIIARLPIDVLQDYRESVACGVAIDQHVVTSGETLLLQHIFTGDVAKVKWSLGGEDLITAAGTTAEYVPSTLGALPGVLRCYNSADQRVGVAQFNVMVTTGADTGYGSSLEASALAVPAGEPIRFSTERAGFTPEEVSRVTWQWTPDHQITGAALTQDNTFAQPGIYPIQQTISFLDERAPLVNSLTVKAYAPAVLGSTYLSGSPLTGTTEQIFDFDLQIDEEIEPETWKQLIWSCDDEQLQTYVGDTIAQHLNFSCSYVRGGPKRVKAYLVTDDDQWYRNEMTIYVVGNDACLTENDYICDMDEDGIPDMCDDDIDGDGVANCMKLLLAEQPDCRIDAENINSVVLRACQDAIRNGVDYDSCPFTPNPDQTDTDGDAWGDVCDPDGSTPPGTGDSSGDTDGDGIADDRDACPGIPESPDGHQDADGCPELPSPADDDRPTGPTVEADDTCDACPCPRADYGSELWQGDRVRALLYDESGELLYRYSSPEIITEDIVQQLQDAIN